eukprot:Sdes_comp19117_c0_seq1m9827
MVSRKKGAGKSLRNTQPSEAEKELERCLFGEQVHLEEYKEESVLDAKVDILPCFTDTNPSDFDFEKFASEAGPETSFFHDSAPTSSDQLLDQANLHTLKPAWVDQSETSTHVDISSQNRLKKLKVSDDETLLAGDEFSHRLREQFQRIHAAPNWALLPEDPPEEDAAEGDSLFLSTCRKLTADANRLPAQKLSVTRLKDATQSTKPDAAIQALQFHPSSPILMTGGFDKVVRLYHIDGEENKVLQSIFFKDLPVHTAAISHDGGEIIVSGRRKYFYSYDLQEGRVVKISGIQGRPEKSLENFWITPDDKFIVFLGQDGTLMLVSRKTKQWVANLKMNGTCRSVSFEKSKGSSFRMLTAGSDGFVYVWDLERRVCVHRFVDEGNIHISASASSSSANFAFGSKNGVVNVYNSECLLESKPKPLKAIMNLTTGIHQMKFNHDGQILSIFSRKKKEALKLVHIPSLTVFQNWPSSNTPLHYVHQFDFSPSSGYMSIGNDKGQVLLYRLHHYTSY